MGLGDYLKGTLGAGALPAIPYGASKSFREGTNKFLFGNENQFNPYNEQSLSALLQFLQGGGLQGNPTYQAGNEYIQNLLSGSPEAFKNFEAPYIQNFEENIAPGIANRFAGMGTGAGALSSSGLNQALAQAGRSLQTDLAGLRSGLQMQVLPQALQYAQSPIMNALQAAGLIPSQYYEIPGQEGAVQGGIKAFANAFAKSMGGF